MKKVVFSLAVLFAAALVSCGNKEAATEATNDTTAMDSAAVVEAPVDTTVKADSTAAVAEVAPVDTAAKAQ